MTAWDGTEETAIALQLDLLGNVDEAHPRPTANGARIDAAERRRSEQAMQQAVKMEAITLLAGGIAHDFNNRLTVILGNLELLELEVGDSAEAQSLIRDARLAAENGSGLARQLLAISRPQQGGRAPTNLNEVIARLEAMLSHCVGKTAELRVRSNPDLPLVEMDASGFEDVLVNLTLNARDAMGDGDCLTIETDRVWLERGQLGGKPGLAPGAYALVAFTDTGAGMPDAVRERACEPYFTTKAEKGTGLGLSMVYSFVRELHGHVAIYSEEGRGTCVKMYIPIEARLPAADVAASDAATTPFSGSKVLVVDDQAQIREVAGRLLRDLGCDVHTLSDAASALEYVSGDAEIDLLFTDIVMPGDLDGIGLATRAKRVRPAMKVLFTSGFTRAGRFDNALPAGPDCEYLAKPWSRTSLADVLARLLPARAAGHGDATALPQFGAKGRRDAAGG